MRTIKNATEIDSLFKQGVRASSGSISLIVRRTPEARGPGGRVLFVAGKRIGGAVLRNRCKRVMRAAVRRCSGPWSGWDVALVARASAAQASPDDLDASVVRCLRKSGVSDQ